MTSALDRESLLMTDWEMMMPKTQQHIISGRNEKTEKTRSLLREDGQELFLSPILEASSSDSSPSFIEYLFPFDSSFLFSEMKRRLPLVNHQENTRCVVEKVSLSRETWTEQVWGLSWVCLGSDDQMMHFSLLPHYVVSSAVNARNSVCLLLRFTYRRIIAKSDFQWCTDSSRRLCNTVSDVMHRVQNQQHLLSINRKHAAMMRRMLLDTNDERIAETKEEVFLQDRYSLNEEEWNL